MGSDSAFLSIKDLFENFENMLQEENRTNRSEFIHDLIRQN